MATPEIEFMTTSTYMGLIGGCLAASGIFITVRRQYARQALGVADTTSSTKVHADLMETGKHRPVSIVLSKRHEPGPEQDDHRPDRQRQPHEPIFGHGAPRFLAELLVAVGALGLVLLALLLASSAREKASRLLFGEPQHSQSPRYDKPATIDGYKLKRID